MSASVAPGLGEFVIVMGVSGSGKSTVAEALALALGGTYIEGDGLHPSANIAAMSEGHALTDDMRRPWLNAICDAAIKGRTTSDKTIVIACSALKRRYRDLLRHRLGTPLFIHLDGDAALIEKRMEARKSHFMPSALLATQIADLERPDNTENVVYVNIAASPEEILATVLRGFRTAARSST